MSESTLMERLRSSELLSPEQLNELAALPEAADPEPKALGKVVLQRGWLTRFQISQAALGKGKDLVIGPYLLLDRIGEGGMGQVFKARHRHMKRVVALKLMRKERLVKEDSVRRFYREVEAAAKLTHPNIVMAFDAGQAGAIHFFSMEYVEGTDLNHLVREKGPLPVAQACDFIRQAALGLQHAHEQGMVHRDIKPSNLLVTAGEGKPVVKILDMGLARLDDTFTQERNLTREGQVLGTPDYLAPEQARDARKVDIRGDIYSLGCTLFFLMTRRSPFTAETLTEVLMKHQMEEPASLRSLRPDAPEGLERLLRRMLAKKPEGRPSTPAEVAAALEPFTRVEKGARVQPRLVVPVAASASQDAETMTSLSGNDRGGVAQRVRGKLDRTRSMAPEFRARKKPEKSNAPLFIAGGVGAGLLLLAMVAGLVWMLRPGKNPENQTTQTPTPQPQNLVLEPGAIYTGPLKDVSPGSQVRAVSFSKDGKQSLTAFDREIVVHDLASGAVLHKMNAGASSLRCMATTKDWQRVATANADRVLRLWNVKTGAMRKAFEEKFDSAPQMLVLSPDGKYALSSGGGVVIKNDKLVLGVGGKPLLDCELRLFNLDTGKVEHRFGGAWKSTSSLAFTDDGNYVVASSPDLPLRVWELKTKTLAPARKPIGLTTAAKIAPAGNSRILLGTPDGSVRLWDCEQGREIARLPGKHNAPITSLAASADGQTVLVVAGGAFKKVNGKTVPVNPAMRVWNVAKPAETASVAFSENPRAVAVSRDGKYALVGITGAVLCIELDKLEAQGQVGPHVDPERTHPGFGEHGPGGSTRRRHRR